PGVHRALGRRRGPEPAPRALRTERRLYLNPPQQTSGRPRSWSARRLHEDQDVGAGTSPPARNARYAKLATGVVVLRQLQDGLGGVVPAEAGDRAAALGARAAQQDAGPAGVDPP